jgi:hypothetical protein
MIQSPMNSFFFNNWNKLEVQIFRNGDEIIFQGIAKKIESFRMAFKATPGIYMPTDRSLSRI